jgi:cardiolipin synthase (CMP-forming)
MNLPNYITLVRIILVPFFIDLMIYGYTGWALIVFLIACVTDALDGMMARLTGSKTELGAFLDPMADKLLIVSAFVTLVFMRMLPVWLVITVVSRDAILALGSIVIYFTGREFKVRPSIFGKAATVMQLLVVTFSLVLHDHGIYGRLFPILHWGAAFLTIISGVQYVARGIKIVGEDIAQRGDMGGNL